jgi:hypothetical protein
MSIFGKKSSDVTFYCFTPVISLTTFFIEFLLALYVLFKYKLTKFAGLTVLTLLCLGTFQLTEFLICKSIYGDLATKMGYIAITLLPALGVHSITTITRKNNLMVASSYICALLLVAGVIFIPDINLRTSCMPFYVDVHVSSWYSLLHSAYYTFYVLGGIYIIWNSLRKHIGDAKEEKWLIFSYAIFLIPSEGLFLLRLIASSAIPSVMCGFAVLAAIILVFVIMPRQHQLEIQKNKNKRKRK